MLQAHLLTMCFPPVKGSKPFFNLDFGGSRSLFFTMASPSNFLEAPGLTTCSDVVSFGRLRAQQKTVPCLFIVFQGLFLCSFLRPDLFHRLPAPRHRFSRLQAAAEEGGAGGAERSQAQSGGRRVLGWLLRWVVAWFLLGVPWFLLGFYLVFAWC